MPDRLTPAKAAARLAALRKVARIAPPAVACDGCAAPAAWLVPASIADGPKFDVRSCEACLVSAPRSQQALRRRLLRLARESAATEARA